MSFLNSIWLWGSLAAAGVAVPIIIHLLSRYRSRPIDWAAMELLRRAMVVRSRRLRLEDLILLLLRCLAAALVALALARPVLAPSGASWFGGDGKAGVVIAIDGSYSMAHAPAAHSRFDAARQRVKELLLSPGDRVTLVVMGNRPYVKLRDVAYDAERFDETLKALQPLAETLNLEVCLEEIGKLAGEIKMPSRECYLITDGQAATWENISAGAEKTLEKLRASCTVFLVPVGSEDAENLAVTRLALASGVLRKGSQVRYVADIRNAGTSSRSNVTVRLSVDKAPVNEGVIDKIGPGETVPVFLFAHFRKAGIFTISAQLGDDLLSVDNARYAVADIRDNVNILCVNGDPSDAPFGGETDFLKAALVPEGTAGAATLNVDTVNPGGLPATRLSVYDIVILANVPEITREQAPALGDFVRNGGGLVVF